MNDISNNMDESVLEIEGCINDMDYNSEDEDSNVENNSNPDSRITEVNSIESLHRVFSAACRSGNVSGVRYLLTSHIVELSMSNRNGQTPLTIACSIGALGVIRHLLNNIDVNSQDNEGNTPLMMAAQAGHSDVIRFLLWSRPYINVDVQNKNGMTALMKAAIRGHSLCARMLIIAGADIEKRDFVRCIRPHEWARLCGWNSTAKVIRRVGSVGAWSFKREELKKGKEKKYGMAKSMYTRLKRHLAQAFNLNQGIWEERVGSLYHLIDRSTNPVYSGWSLVWSVDIRLESPAELNKEISQLEISHIETTHSTQTREGVVKNKKKKTKVIPRNVVVPEIYCYEASPSHKKKKKNKSHQQDKKFLQIPPKKYKNKC